MCIRKLCNFNFQENLQQPFQKFLSPNFAHGFTHLGIEFHLLSKQNHQRPMVSNSQPRPPVTGDAPKENYGSQEVM